LEVLLFFSTDHSCTVNTTALPSGERAGDPSRFKAHRSCAVIGRLSAATATIPIAKTDIKRRVVRKIFFIGAVS